MEKNSTQYGVDILDIVTAPIRRIILGWCWSCLMSSYSANKSSLFESGEFSETKKLWSRGVNFIFSRARRAAKLNNEYWIFWLFKSSVTMKNWFFYQIADTNFTRRKNFVTSESAYPKLWIQGKAGTTKAGTTKLHLKLHSTKYWIFWFESNNTWISVMYETYIINLPCLNRCLLEFTARKLRSSWLKILKFYDF